MGRIGFASYNDFNDDTLEKYYSKLSIARKENYPITITNYTNIKL
jgi:hypothetical protein